jgi:hypothetical protein
MQNWGGGNKNKYLALKEEVKKTLIEKAGMVVPNLETYNVFDDTTTPLIYERSTQFQRSHFSMELESEQEIL